MQQNLTLRNVAAATTCVHVLLRTVPLHRTLLCLLQSLLARRAGLWLCFQIVECFIELLLFVSNGIFLSYYHYDVDAIYIQTYMYTLYFTCVSYVYCMTTAATGCAFFRGQCLEFENLYDIVFVGLEALPIYYMALSWETLEQ